MKKPEMLTVAVERGASGFSGAWCLELPGCYALVPPETRVEERVELAILEFAAWAHNRAAERLVHEREHIEVVQVLDTGADVRSGNTSAFFLHDGEVATPREFPIWANAHDLALDELRELTASLPQVLFDHVPTGWGATLRSVVDHVSATELAYGVQLRAGQGAPKKDLDLRGAHRWLQEVVCDVAPGTRVRLPGGGPHMAEEWSVRKVMRRSIWHLRYHTWEMRRSLAGLWLA